MKTTDAIVHHIRTQHDGHYEGTVMGLVREAGLENHSSEEVRKASVLALVKQGRLHATRGGSRNRIETLTVNETHVPRLRKPREGAPGSAAVDAVLDYLHSLPGRRFEGTPAGLAREPALAGVSTFPTRKNAIYRLIKAGTLETVTDGRSTRAVRVPSDAAVPMRKIEPVAPKPKVCSTSLGPIQKVPIRDYDRLRAAAIGGLVGLP